MASEKERDFDQELKQLLVKATQIQKEVGKDQSFRNVRGKSRDVMIHVAVTIMPRVNGMTVVGEKEDEICQFAVDLPAKRMPVRISVVKRCFEELSVAAYKRMIVANLVGER